LHARIVIIAPTGCPRISDGVRQRPSLPDPPTATAQVFDVVGISLLFGPFYLAGKLDGQGGRVNPSERSITAPFLALATPRLPA
jgi:hypothetical protein